MNHNIRISTDDCWNMQTPKLDRHEQQLKWRGAGWTSLLNRFVDGHDMTNSSSKRAIKNPK